MNPEEIVKGRQDELAREMEDLIKFKDQLSTKLSNVDTRMTQIIGAMQELNSIMARLDHQQQAVSEILEAEIAPEFQEPQSSSRSVPQGSGRSKGQHKRKKG